MCLATSSSLALTGVVVYHEGVNLLGLGRPQRSNWNEPFWSTNAFLWSALPCSYCYLFVSKRNCWPAVCLLQDHCLPLRCYVTCWGSCLSHMWSMSCRTYCSALVMETSMSERWVRRSYPVAIASSAYTSLFLLKYTWMVLPDLSYYPTPCLLLP